MTVPFAAQHPDRPPEPTPRGSDAAASATVDLGPLAVPAAEPGVTDVFVLGDGSLWYDRGNGVERAGGHLGTAEARQLAVRLVSLGGRHVDDATPCADVRLGDGLRVHAVLPPISTGGALVSVRLPRARALGVDDLERAGFFAAVGSAVLRAAIRDRRNLLVTGAGGSGKTTLLGALLALAPPTERIVVLEDVAELRIAHPHVVSLEARQANLDGAGGLALDRLLREALRMRPDRLVVGECRGPETRDLLAALNTGHDGGAGTLHANSLADVPARLEALGATAGMTPDQVARQAASALHVIAHLERGPAGRRLVAVGRFVVDAAGRLQIEEVAT